MHVIFDKHDDWFLVQNSYTWDFVNFHLWKVLLAKCALKGEKELQSGIV